MEDDGKQSMRQTEPQEIGRDNRHGGRMDEWSSQRRSTWSKELSICQRVMKIASLLLAVHIREGSLRIHF